MDTTNTAGSAAQNTITAGTMNEILNTAHSAGQQTDRVLFLGALIILGLFVLAVIRYIVKQNEKLINQHETTLLKMHSDAVDLQKNTLLVVQQNVTALKEMTDELVEFRIIRTVKIP